MVDAFRKISQILLRLAAGLAGVAPVHVFAAGNDTEIFTHLATDTTIIATLTFITGLLLGFLIRIVQLRHEVSRKTLALEKSNNHLRLMGDNLPNVTLFQLVCSPNDVFTFNYLSKGYERALDIARDRIIQDAKLAFDHIYEADIPTLQDAHRQAIEKLTPVDLEIRVLDLSGNLKWLRVSAVPHREKDTLVWDGFIQDISDSKELAKAFSERVHNFQTLFENITDNIYFKDTESRFIMVNKAFCNWVGVSGEDIIGKSDFELFSALHAQQAFDNEQAIIQTGEPLVGIEEKETWPDGRFTWVSTTKMPRRDDSDKIIGTFGISRDITIRRQTEIALRESQQMLQLIMNTIPISVFWKDKDSVYLGCNNAFIKECGLVTVDDVVGKTPFDLFNKDAAPSVIARDRQVITTNQPMYNYTISHTAGDGTIRRIEASKIPLRDENDQAIGVLGVWSDITEQNQGEERLKQTLEDMERFNQLMRGRERRTLELKAEINTLLMELGRQIKYKTTSDGPS